MSARRIHVERIVLRLRGLPVAQAEMLGAQLQAALVAQAGAVARPEDGEPTEGIEANGTGAERTRLQTSLTGEALTQAVAARLVLLIGEAAKEPSWP